MLSNITGSHEDISPAYGHLNICYGCGISIASRRTHKVELDCPQCSMILRWTLAHLAPHLQRVCIPCWLAATRETRRLEVQNRNRPDSVMDASSPSLEDSGIPEPPPMPAPTPQPQQALSCELITQDSPSSVTEIKVFCPRCNTEVAHTTDGIQADQTKILIAKVYHYFEHEYEELKKLYGDLDLTPLSKFGQRTALATGVSETTVLQILKEEEGRNADKRQEPPEKRRRARKRSRQTDSSSEEAITDDDLDDGGQSSSVQVAQNESEIETLVVKIEPPEHYKEQAQTDPLSAEVKAEPPDDDDVNNTNETLALNEPAGTKRKARKIPRSDVTSTRQHTQGESSTTAAASSVRLAEELDGSGLLGESDVKVEEIEIEEEGFS